MLEAGLLHFVRLPTWERSVQDLLGADEELAVEAVLRANPEAGQVIPGSGGFRKMRVGLAGRGKRGGARVIYFWQSHLRRVYLVLAYGKNVRDTLTRDELVVLKAIARRVRGEGEGSRAP